MHGVGDKAFVQDLQKAADWLAARSVLPQKINVSEYLAKV
jgi:sulfonate transport system substrate-binding protein